MLTRTSELAIRALIVIGLEGAGRPVSPGQVAGRLSCSASYLAKTLGALVRSGILRSVRGARGGVVLGRRAEEISLLSIVEASQGLVNGSYCQPVSGPRTRVCSFHEVMERIHRDTRRALSESTLADLLKRPTAPDPPRFILPCRMTFAGCEAHVTPAKGRKRSREH